MGRADVDNIVVLIELNGLAQARLAYAENCVGQKTNLTAGSSKVSRPRTAVFSVCQQPDHVSLAPRRNVKLVDELAG